MLAQVNLHVMTLYSSHYIVQIRVDMPTIIDFQFAKFAITFLLLSISTNDPLLESSQCQEDKEAIVFYLER